VMYALVNLFAYVLQSMLPPAIEGLTLSNELNVNTSTIFDSIEAEKEMANAADMSGAVSRPGNNSNNVSALDRNLASAGKSLNSAKNMATLRV
jgi:hypothetical protein